MVIGFPVICITLLKVHTQTHQAPFGVASNAAEPVGVSLKRMADHSYGDRSNQTTMGWQKKQKHQIICDCLSSNIITGVTGN